MSSQVGTVPAPGGYIEIAPTALKRVSTAAASEVFGVPARHISVEAKERQDRLDLQVTLPLGAPSLSEILERPGALEAFGGTISQRVEAGRARLRERTAALTGSNVGRVDVIVTSVSLQRAGGRGLK